MEFAGTSWRDWGGLVANGTFGVRHVWWLLHPHPPTVRLQVSATKVVLLLHRAYNKLHLWIFDREVPKMGSTLQNVIV